MKTIYCDPLSGQAVFFYASIRTLFMRLSVTGSILRFRLYPLDFWLLGDVALSWLSGGDLPQIRTYPHHPTGHSLLVAF